MLNTKRTVLILLVTILVITANLSAGSNINGRVIDQGTNRPINGVSIKCDKIVTGIKTDHDGHFTLPELTTDTVKITISHVGYQSITQKVVISDTPFLTIKLSETSLPVGGIVVTASRFEEQLFDVPQNLSITSRRQFVERETANTSEFLREEPGILVQKTTYGHGTPIIRGLIGRYVLILYNGIRLNKPTFRMGGNQYLNTIDAGSLERIEVTRGPASVMYGSDAMGGAVNLISNVYRPKSDELTVTSKAITRFSSADKGSQVSGGIGLDYHRWFARVTATYKDIGDLRAGGDIGRQEPTGWTESDFSGRV